MSRKLLFFFLIAFFGLNGCLYSCNYPSQKVIYKNTDPCDASNGSQLLRFIDITNSSDGMGIHMVMLLPCQGDGQSSEVFSLAFYNADNVVQPTDLTNIKASWNFSDMNHCDIKGNSASVAKIESDPNFKALSLGSAISFAVGHTYSNRLYPFGIKIPYTNTYTDGNCKPGSVDMSPFIPEGGGFSPVFQKGRVVLSELDRISSLYSGYSNEPISIGAPFFTMATKFQPTGSNEGLKSDPGQVKDGSFFQFNVRIKPGRYYVVLSKVPNPMGAVTGDFSLKDVKIFNDGVNGTKYKNYLTDCNKSVTCGTPVTIS